MHTIAHVLNGNNYSSFEKENYAWEIAVLINGIIIRLIALHHAMPNVAHATKIINRSILNQILTANFILFVAAKLLYGPWMVCSNEPESATHTHSNPSRSADIIRRESIITTTRFTVAACPLNVLTTRPSTRPQTITVLSSAPDTINSTFGEKLTHVTVPVCPSNVCVNCGTLICQICTVLAVATADNCESRDMSKHVAGVILAAFINARWDNESCRNGFPFLLWRRRCGGGSSLRNE